MVNYKIAIGSDHAGYKLKAFISTFLQHAGHQIIDKGTNSEDSCDYPDFIHPVACAVENKAVDLGIVVCGSGNGAAITANKHQKIRAALCWNAELAALAKQHNDANILALPSRYISEMEALEIVDAFLTAQFEGDRHIRRINKIANIACP